MSSQIDIQLLSYKKAQRIRITLFAAEILEHIQMKHLWLFPIIFTKQITKKRLKEVILVYSRSYLFGPNFNHIIRQYFSKQLRKHTKKPKTWS